MKKIFTTILAVWFFSFAKGQVTQEWAQTFSPASAAYMAMDNAGNIYTAGSASNSQVLLKYDPMGNLLWSQINPAVDGVSAMAADGNGDAILTTASTATSGIAIKYDANGSLLWTFSTSFLPKSVAIDESNNIYLHGQGSAGLQTVKLNSAGIQQWIVSYIGDFYADLRKKMIYKYGYVYITGDITKSVSKPSQNVRHILTIKYNALNGAQVWAGAYTHADKHNQYGTDLIVDGTGNIYVIGPIWVKAANKFNCNWGTLKYNASGSLQWVKFYDGNGNDYSSLSGSQGLEVPYDIAFDNSGNIIVCGTSYETTGQFTSQDMTTIKYNPSGTQLWVRTYDDPSHSNNSTQAITSDGSSNVYITGSYVAGNQNATTIKYNSAGVVQWMINYTGGISRALVLDNSANVYVSGSAASNSLLIKYSQGGGSITSKNIDPMQESSFTKMRLFPNPANNQLTIQNSENKMLGTVSIYDMTGKMIFKKRSVNSIITIDLGKFTAGLYYIKSDNLQATMKFVKQ